MSLVTLFSAPKPFTDPHIAAIQRNAVKSWTLLPEVEVLLMGDEPGMAQVAQELDVKHLPEVRCSSSGTPLISSMFQLARENSRSDLLCIINADMILMSDFIEAACSLRFPIRGHVQRDKFVLLSQRWDLDITQPLEFKAGWQEQLRSTVYERGSLHRPAGSDFFLFPLTSYLDIPNFAIGRAGWDNWMIYKACQEGWPVIDCTPSLMIVHQNHDYRHLPGAKSHYTHPETNENIRLAGGSAAVRYTILDATHRLVDGELVRPVFSRERFWRGVELFLRKIFFFLPETSLENIARPKRWKKRFKKLFK